MDGLLAIVPLTAFLAAGLTMYSGFGLGTLLLPVFSLFFPVEMAVVATALVHGANNVFKVALLGRLAQWGVVLRFGVPAVIAAIAGAAVLGWFSASDLTFSYELGWRTLVLTPVKGIVGVLMMVFALFELLPRFRRLEFGRRYLPLGGIFSGFFGGLSGHQGALRSAFLAKSGLSTEQFVGTNAVIGFLVDICRIAVYISLAAVAGSSFSSPDTWPLVITGSLAAFAGVLVGRRFLKRVTMRNVQMLVGVLLLLVALGLMSGFI